MEILESKFESTNRIVAPLVGAWIEIMLSAHCVIPSIVAPLVGAWIEIYNHFELIDEKAVAPLVGAWIEIFRRKCVQ